MPSLMEPYTYMMGTHLLVCFFVRLYTILISSLFLKENSGYFSFYDGRVKVVRVACLDPDFFLIRVGC